MITQTEPKVADTGRYTTKQAYEALGMSRSTFGRYVEAGLIRYGERRHQRNRMGAPRKFFTGQAIKQLWRTI